MYIRRENGKKGRSGMGKKDVERILYEVSFFYTYMADRPPSGCSTSPQRP